LEGTSDDAIDAEEPNDEERRKDDDADLRNIFEENFGFTRFEAETKGLDDANSDCVSVLTVAAH
jgi:hypothetical protein